MIENGPVEIVSFPMKNGGYMFIVFCMFTRGYAIDRQYLKLKSSPSTLVTRLTTAEQPSATHMAAVTRLQALQDRRVCFFFRVKNGVST
jgi:hypothetical protein